MALTIFLIAAFMAATANGGYVWQDDDDSSIPTSKFPHMSFPAFPTFPAFPQFPFPTFHPFPSIPPIVFPSAADIAKKKGNYNGVFVSTSSASKVDKDGKVVETGGTSILTNKDGVVKEIQVGDAPPDLDESPQPFVMPQPPPFVMPQLPPFVMPQPPLFAIPQIPVWQPFFPSFKPMDPEKMKKYKPGKNEHFVGSSSSAYSSSSDINGVQKNTGTASVLSNVNGKVKEKTVHFGENEV